jgi:hypothetical protein
MEKMETKVKAKIEIVYVDGQLLLSGPVHDKILCLGMLELAKTIVTNGTQAHIGNVPPIVDMKKGLTVA